MAVDVGSAFVTIMPSMDGFSAHMDRALKRAGSSGSSAFSRAFLKGTKGAGAAFDGPSKACEGFSAKMAAIGGAAAGLAMTGVQTAMSAISSSIDSAISRVDTMANFPRVMENLGYSSSDAAEAVDTMSERLQALPTRLDDMTSGVQRLVPAVRDVGAATDIMLAFNDAVLAGGAAQEVQAAALEQFSQSVSKGKFELEEWRSIQTAMPGQLDQLAKSLLGGSAGAQDLYRSLSDGTVSMSDFLDALVRLDTEGGAGFASFQKQAEDSVSGIATSMANAGNAVTKGVARIIESFGSGRIVSVVNTVRDGISGAFGSAADAVGSFMDRAEENGSLDLLSNSLGDLAGAAGDVAGAAGSLLGALLGIPEGADPAQAAADGLKSALEAAQPFVRGVADAAGWLRDNASQAAPYVAALAGGFLLLKTAQGVSSVVSGVSTALGGIGAAAAPASSALGSVGSASAMSAPQILAVGAAVLMVGGGVLLAATGLSALAASAVAVAGAGPGAAVALVGMVAGVAGLGAAAVVAGPALTASAVGLVAFGAAVLMVGAGVGVAAAGISLLAAQFPAVSAYGASAAASLVAIGAASVAVGAGATVAGAGVAVLSAALVAGSAGVAAFAVAVGAGSAAVTAAAGAFGLLSGAVSLLAGSVGSTADGLGRVATRLSSIGAAAPRAASGFTSFSSTSSSALRSLEDSARRSGDAAVSAIASACSRMESEVRGMALTLPRIRVGALPHFRMTGLFNPQTGSVPSVSVSWYARGAVFAPGSPRLIGIGDNRRYDEAALPLSPEVLAGIGRGIAQQMEPGQAAAPVPDQTFNIYANDPRLVAAMVARRQLAAARGCR